MEESLIRAAMFVAGLAVGHVVGWGMHKRRMRHVFKRPRRRRYRTEVVKECDLVEFVKAHDLASTPDQIGKSDYYLVDHRLPKGGGGGE